VTGLGAQARASCRATSTRSSSPNDAEDVTVSIKIGDAKLDSLITLAKRRRGP